MPQIAGFRGVLQGDVSKRDPSRAVYRYHQAFPGPGGRSLIRKTLICAVRLSPWTEGTIRPHEATAPAARDAALAKIKSSATHAEPFLAGFHDAATEVDRLMRRAEASAATFQHATKDGVVHQLWRVQDAEVLGKLRHHFAPKKLHVLDGHHTYEAMLAYHGELAAKHSLTMYSSANYGLGYLVNLDDPVLASAPRHRIVKGIGGATSAALIAAAAPHFIVDKLAGAAGDLGKLHAALSDTVAHQPAFVAVFAGEPDAWKLTLKPDVSPVAEGVAVHRAVQKMDPIAIQHMFLDRHLAKAQVTTELDAQTALAALGKTPASGGAAKPGDDKGGAAGPASGGAAKLGDDKGGAAGPASGGAAKPGDDKGGAAGAELVLITRPVPVSQIEHVDELGQLLPAGSTAFHPPILPGLVSMIIDPDEDLI